MSIVLAILVLLCLWRLQLSHFHSDYCAPSPSAALKGVLAIIILCSHLCCYIPVDRFAGKALTYLGQSMVAPYLFLSGFGIKESLRNKPGYSNQFFKNRFLKTLIHFDLAVLLYFITAICLHSDYPIKNFLLCWTGWEGIGNDNWFMFVILSLYLLVLLAMKSGEKLLVFKVFILTSLLWVMLFFLRKAQPWWYDTLLAFPLGMLFSVIKPKWDQRLQHPLVWTIVLLGLLALYIGAHHLFGVDKGGLVSCTFCLILITLSMKLKIGNPVLAWLGAHAFSIYILQRLPMMIFSYWGINQYPILFLVMTFIFTLLAAWGFPRLNRIIDMKLFSSK